uniref:Uncharacterized protein n=1 Tax=Glossina pallidipes TaxID=7398 RepID=A0A1A9ZMY0_GLOPL
MHAMCEVTLRNAARVHMSAVKQRPLLTYFRFVIKEFIQLTKKLQTNNDVAKLNIQSACMCPLDYEHQVMLMLHSRPHRKLKALPDSPLDNGHDLYRNLPQLAHDLSAAYLTNFEKEFNDNIKKLFHTEILQQSCLKWWFDYFDSTLRLLWLSDLQRPCAFAPPYM